MQNNKLQGVIWDFDGTLADTWNKNFNVTKKIVKSILDCEASKFLTLQNLENYKHAHKTLTNWRQFYKQSFGMNEEQIDEAGKLWSEYQLADDTPVVFFDGINNVIRNMSWVPQGIVSQNSQKIIIRSLEENELRKYFNSIVGYEEVDLRKQKPEPDGLLLCLEHLGITNSGFVAYIGDHETDIYCAKNANKFLEQQGSKIRIISIGAFYCSNHKISNWEVLPDFDAKSVEDIFSICQRFHP